MFATQAEANDLDAVAVESSAPAEEVSLSLPMTEHPLFGLCTVIDHVKAGPALD
jgi:hypothetical protein